MSCLPWSYLCLPPPTISEAACQHQLSCWNLPSESSLSPWYSGCPAPAHRHSQTPPQPCPGMQQQAGRTCGFPQLSAGFCSVPSAVLSTHLDVTSPASSDPYTSSCSTGLDLAAPLLLHGSLPGQMETPEDESRLDQAAWACCAALVNMLKLCPSASHSKASPRVLRSEVRGPF